MRGSIVKLTQFHFGAVQLGLSQDPTSTLDTTTALVPLVIEGFVYVGADGCPTHGDPRFVMAVPAVRLALAHYKHFGRAIQLPPSQTQAPLGSSFDPEELARLDEFTSQIDPAILDEDDPLDGVELVIPATQQQILDSISVEKIDELVQGDNLEEASSENHSNSECLITANSDEMDKLIVQYYQNRLSRSLSIPTKYKLWAEYCFS